MFPHLCLVTLCLALSLALLPRPALAGKANNCVSGDLPANRVINTKIPDDLALGSLIPGSEIRFHVNVTCLEDRDTLGVCNHDQGGWGLVPSSRVTPTRVPGYSDVFTYAGLPSNIGYQIISKHGTSIFTGDHHRLGIQRISGTSSLPIHFRAIKISDDLQSGPFSIEMGLLCGKEGIEWANGDAANSIITLGLNVEVTTQTCHLNEPDTQVMLPQVARSSFKRIGDSAGATPFDLHILCESNASARLNISDVTNHANATDTLTLVSGSTASGLGVRLRHEGNPVLLASHQIFDAGGSEFSLRHISSTQNMISLPLSAEYVQTGGIVTAGRVMAQGMVTIDYN